MYRALYLAQNNKIQDLQPLTFLSVADALLNQFKQHHGWQFEISDEYNKGQFARDNWVSGIEAIMNDQVDHKGYAALKLGKQLPVEDNLYFYPGEITTGTYSRLNGIVVATCDDSLGVFFDRFSSYVIHTHDGGLKLSVFKDGAFSAAKAKDSNYEPILAMMKLNAKNPEKFESVINHGGLFDYAFKSEMPMSFAFYGNDLN